MTALTIKALVHETAAQLRMAGVEGPRRDAELIAGHALGLDRAALIAHGDDPVTDEAAARIAAMAADRAARRPMAQVLGTREFWSMRFKVTAATLDPRPDTETLVEAVLAVVGLRLWKPLRILDLGTGTGCILAALLRECPAATGIGIDRSPAAVAVAAENMAALGLGGRATIVEGDWAAGIDERFDVVVSNPPYIPEADMQRLAPEVRLFEPRGALTPGGDGLGAYREILAQVPRVAAPGAIVAFEVGIGQADIVAAMMEACGLGPVTRKADLGGIPRVVLGQA
ncbi:peptide chain release factor N(5)-glutamine methyltransferase [Zavarzinia compransoris]|uniref:Release factor glutamine methyltransferase n=1 Tax=Zavarzinia compransoris TaxID=1264899 RepID=A0A317E6Z5_9PROT|nr:peptide chain release factor N(5)-glutamine methyltransferase [Zavarzinia compransoris]PWR22391.1 peptide chain release factor N(5)-glutamine methyltransferase [Zavarzinia compransoris]TDP46838.1 release factor glutamine methyltransferase [Zavarzinia compransoris]